MGYSQNWLDLEEALGGRVTIAGTPEEIKAMAAGMSQTLAAQAPPPSDAVTAQDGNVDGISYRLYKPKGASGPLPVGIWTHGGGFMTGSIEDDDAYCRVVSEHAPSIIISVEYSLTPEFKAPKQLEETLAVFKWAQQNAASYGGDPRKFFTIGGSAGASIALQVANRLVGDASKRSNIRGVVAIMPATLHQDNVPEEFKGDYNSHHENGKGAAILDAGSMKIFLDHYGGKADDADLFVSLSKNLQHYPPVYFVSCEMDPLRDDAKILEKQLKAVGVPTKHDFYEGCPHYFQIFESLPETRTYKANLINGVKWLIGQM